MALNGYPHSFSFVKYAVVAVIPEQSHKSINSTLTEIQIIFQLLQVKQTQTKINTTLIQSNWNPGVTYIFFFKRGILLKLDLQFWN